MIAMEPEKRFVQIPEVRLDSQERSQPKMENIGEMVQSQGNCYSCGPNISSRWVAVPWVRNDRRRYVRPVTGYWDPTAEGDLTLNVGKSTKMRAYDNFSR